MHTTVTMNIEDIHRIHLAETSSTNTYARQLAQQESILLVSTDHQTAGRGQRGNSWEAEPGANLLFSLAITPHGKASWNPAPRLEQRRIADSRLRASVLMS